MNQPDTNNEVARLCCPYCKAKYDQEKFYRFTCGTLQKYPAGFKQSDLCRAHQEIARLKAELARLATAPEEAVTEKDSKVSVKAPPPYLRYGMTIGQWRELGKDEVICEGDECRYKGEPEYECAPTSFIGMDVRVFPFYLFRTRRPLCPNDALKKEDMPRDIDVLIDTIAFRGERKGEGVFYSVADAIRYLRDEIAKLKYMQDQHTQCLHLTKDEVVKLKATVNKTTPNS